MSQRASSLKLGLGLGLAVALDTATQIAWKAGVAAAPADLPAMPGWQMAASLLRHPLLLAVVALMSAQYLNWMTVLRRADLSYAHSFTSLSYVTVALCSAVILGERLDALQFVGIGLILSGVWFVGASGRPVKRLRGEST